MKKIPFNKPFIIGKELFYISQAVLKGHLSGDGEFTKRCHHWIEHEFSVQKALLTHSCTAALEMAAILADIKEGDEVIMPSFTFVSTANAFLLRGAKITFIDIREDTLNLDERLIEQKVTEQTKAIVPVHYGGVACEMDVIMDLAKKHELLVIEDAAQAVNATYKGKYLGSIGDLGAYSFHETKNFICGEGGALLLNRQSFFERAEIIREKGTNRSQFFKGEVDKYSWVDIGSSYLPSELTAAFLFAQLEEANKITQKRREIFDRYMEGLLPLQKQGFLRLPVTLEPESVHNAHLFYILIKSNAGDRDRLILFLKEQGIHVVFHYVPLHRSPMGEKMGYKEGDFPITEELSDRLIRLPCFFELSRNEQERIISQIFSFFKQL